MTILPPMLFPLTAMNRVNKENVALLVVLFMLLVCPQLSACSEIRPIYTIQDSGKRGVGVSGWLDNDRVVFYSEQQAQAKVGDDPVGPSIVDAGYYVWNTESGTLSKDPRFEGAAKLCVQGNVVTFLRKSPGEEEQWLVVTRVNGEENVAPLVNTEWFNRFTCRYYQQRPEWAVSNHESLPLMDGHGFLDWTSGEKQLRENQRITLYLTDEPEGIKLPIRMRQIWRSEVVYAPFKNAYLFAPHSYIDSETGREDPIGLWPKGKPVPVWWLKPDGTVTTETVPYMPFMRGGSRAFFPTREGIFVTSHKTDDLGKPGDAGGYLARNDRVTKLITGMVDRVSISSDGCRVAFVHDPYDTMYGKDRLNRITVKVINICQENRHAR